MEAVEYNGQNFVKKYNNQDENDRPNNMTHTENTSSKKYRDILICYFQFQYHVNTAYIFRQDIKIQKVFRTFSILLIDCLYHDVSNDSFTGLLQVLNPELWKLKIVVVEWCWMGFHVFFSIENRAPHFI